MLVNGTFEYNLSRTHTCYTGVNLYEDPVSVVEKTRYENSTVDVDCFRCDIRNWLNNTHANVDEYLQIPDCMSYTYKAFRISTNLTMRRKLIIFVVY